MHRARRRRACEWLWRGASIDSLVPVSHAFTKVSARVYTVCSGGVSKESPSVSYLRSARGWGLGVG